MEWTQFSKCSDIRIISQTVRQSDTCMFYHFQHKQLYFASLFLGLVPPCIQWPVCPLTGLTSARFSWWPLGEPGPRRGRDPAVIWAFSNIFCQIVIDSMSQKYPLALQTLNISLENNYKMKITLQIMSTIQFFAVIFVHLWDGCQSAGSNCSSL